METEIDQLLNSKEGITLNTQKTYRLYWNRFIRTGEIENVHEAGQEKLIKMIREMSDNANTRRSYVSFCIVVKKHFLKPFDELVRERTRLVLNVQEHTKERNNETQFPTYEEMNKMLEWFYKESKWTDYALLYLMMQFNVRNLDLDILLTKSKDGWEKNKNYLLIKQQHVVYRRANYKTVETYGIQNHFHKNRKLVNALNAIYKEDNQPLLSTDGRTKTSNIGRFIKDHTSGWGETVVFKAMVNHFRNDPKKLEEMGKLRGSDMSNVLSYYWQDKDDNGGDMSA